jgi:hypothetical protein
MAELAALQPHVVLWDVFGDALEAELRTATDGQRTPQTVGNAHINSVWAPVREPEPGELAPEHDPREVLMADPDIGMRLRISHLAVHDSFCEREEIVSNLRAVSGEDDIIAVADVEPGVVVRDAYDDQGRLYKLRYTHQGVILALLRTFVSRELYLYQSGPPPR